MMMMMINHQITETLGDLAFKMSNSKSLIGTLRQW